MNESEWNTIYRNFSLMDTDELIGYWQKHDEKEWTSIAFDVMEKILKERLGKLPCISEIIDEKSSKDGQEKKTNALTEIKTLIMDNEPVFYDPTKVTALVKWIFRFLNILIILYIIQFLFNNIPLVRALFTANNGISSLWVDLVISLSWLLIMIIVLFLQYKTLGYVLKILREMEMNSRKS